MLKTAFCERAAYGRTPYLTKTLLLAMKLTALFFTVGFLNVSAAVVSQNVTFSGENVPIKKVLSDVEKQTGYLFLYQKNDLASAKPVTITANNQLLLEFLDEIFKDQPLRYWIESKTINISRLPPVHFNTSLVPPSFFTPPITIRGSIINEKGEPVVATIIIKGTTRGTTSNSDGLFEIQNVQQDAILIISAANIETKEVKVSGRNVIDIHVIMKTTTEEEVVINGGYYKTYQRSKTGNIGRVDSKDIEKQPVSNLLAALSGEFQVWISFSKVVYQVVIFKSGYEVRIVLPMATIPLS